LFNIWRGSGIEWKGGEKEQEAPNIARDNSPVLSYEMSEKAVLLAFYMCIVPRGGFVMKQRL